MNFTALVLSLLLTPCVASLKNENNTYLYSNNQQKIILREHFSPQDPYYTGEKKVKSNYNLPDCDQSITYKFLSGMEGVWEKYKGRGVTIAVIDTGLDTTHPDFKGKISEDSAYIYTGNNKELVINKGEKFLSHDPVRSNRKYNDHGTNTAGVALAGTGEEGTIGIAPEATLLAIKSSLDSISVSGAIKYCADKGADIINLSVGAYSEPYKNEKENKFYDVKGKDYFEGTSTSMEEALDYAYSKNVIVVASAGNESTTTNSYPSSNRHVIGVGALSYESDKKLADFSNYNSSTAKEGDLCNVDICAPGFVVTPSFNGESTYVQTQGTSFSAPIVAGAAALWKEKHPHGNPEQFFNDLKVSATDLGDKGWDNKFGYGSINIVKLLNTGSLIELEIGETYQLDKNEGNTFASEDESIATVDETGLITAISKGNTKIIVTSGPVTKEYDVHVIIDKETYNPLTDGFIKGCSGNISTTSTIISLLSVAFVGLLLIKKYKKKIIDK